MFVDVEAEVEDEDEELEEEDDDLGGEAFLADTHPDDELPVGDVSDDRRHRELDRARQAQEDLDAEKAAALMRERYGRNRVSAVDAVVVPQRLLLPSVEDPTIWGVRCKPGKEREVVFALMKRLQDRAHTREPLQITAAFERGGTMTGFVYIEARKQADVITACDALPSAYPRNNMVLVPINEMPDLLKTQKTKSLEPGMYVRMKRGRYQGDLAQVEEVETNGLEVEVRLVPRLDYGAAEDPNAPMITNGPIGPAAKRKRQNAIGKTLSTRPPQRLFSDVDARKKHARHLQQVSSYNKKQFQYLGDTYIGGFLVKSFKIQLLQTEDVNPTLEEVTKFTAGAEDGTENLDLAAIAATLKASNASTNYLPGDMVEIFHGEQRGVCGKAITVHGDIVSIRVTDGELRGQLLDAPVKGLRKRFREGDHVKVIGGSKYHDEVGMVVRIKDDRVTLLSDSTNQEITVFSKDLRAATDAGTAGSDSKYDLYDLVQLDPSTVGCVVKVDRESLRVLDQFGSMRVLLPSNISNKLGQRRFAVATDRDGTEIRGEDTVKEVSGEQRQGRVLHIHRLYLFLQNRQQTENAGIFVTRNSNVVTVAAKGMRPANAGPDLSKMNPLAQRGAGGGASMAPPKSFGRDRLLGKTVVIRKGPNKGLLGIVKDANDTDARVELHTKKNLVSVAKENLSVKDPVSGQTIDFARFSGGGRGGGGVGGGPFSGRPGATPSRVPAGWDHEGSRTPSAFNNGGKTPAWGATGGGSRTPGWSRSGGGGGGGYPSGAGSRTPAAWGDGSRTANPYADGSRTAYGGATSYGGVRLTRIFSPLLTHLHSTNARVCANPGLNMEPQLLDPIPHLVRILLRQRLRRLLRLTHPSRMGRGAHTGGTRL